MTAPDPPAGLPLPALVARVRGEGERLLEAQSKATPGPYSLDRGPYGILVSAPDCYEFADFDTTDHDPARARADAEMFASIRNSALPADALALCGRAERLEKENRRLRDTLIEMTRTERLSAGMTWQVYGRQAHDLAVAALAGEPAEGDAGGGRS
jgi:hypothetical protein